MKKILLFLFVSSLFIYSCSSDNEDCTIYNPYEIHLNAAIETPISRNGIGPLNSTFATNFPIGVYAYKTAWLAGSTANIINNDNATVAGTAEHSVAFTSGPYYYPSNGTLLNFFAYAPHGIEVAPAGAGTPPSVRIPISGSDDVMWCTSTGQKAGSSPAQAPVLAFQHKLTQLQFTFKADAPFPSGAVVTSLLVKAQPSNVHMNIGTGATSFTGAADMQALSTASQASGISITTGGTDAKSPVMTAPASGATAYTLSIDVKPSGSSTSVTYTAIVNITSVMDNAHMITITFKGAYATATATVSNWQTGGTSNVTVI